MKTLIAFLILILSGEYCFAQRVAINEIDKFTDNKIFKVDVSEGKRWKPSDNITKGLMNYFFLSTRLIKNSNSKIVLSNFNLQFGISSCVNPSNGKIIILFDDNSKITLNQISEIACNLNLNVEYSIYDNSTNNKENILALSSKEINSFRIYFTDGYKDLVVKDEKKEIIRKHYQLILEELNMP